MGLDSKKILAKGEDIHTVTLNLIEKLRNGAVLNYPEPFYH